MANGGQCRGAGQPLSRASGVTWTLHGTRPPPSNPGGRSATPGRLLYRTSAGSSSPRPRRAPAGWTPWSARYPRSALPGGPKSGRRKARRCCGPSWPGGSDSRRDGDDKRGPSGPRYFPRAERKPYLKPCLKTACLINKTSRNMSLCAILESGCRLHSTVSPCSVWFANPVLMRGFCIFKVRFSSEQSHLSSNKTV